MASEANISRGSRICRKTDPGTGALQLFETLAEPAGGAVELEFVDGTIPMAAQSAP